MTGRAPEPPRRAVRQLPAHHNSEHQPRWRRPPVARGVPAGLPAGREGDRRHQREEPGAQVNARATHRGRVPLAPARGRRRIVAVPRAVALPLSACAGRGPRRHSYLVLAASSPPAPLLSTRDAARACRALHPRFHPSEQRRVAPISADSDPILSHVGPHLTPLLPPFPATAWASFPSRTLSRWWEAWLGSPQTTCTPPST